jgi:hypothetical protein
VDDKNTVLVNQYGGYSSAVLVILTPADNLNSGVAFATPEHPLREGNLGLPVQAILLSAPIDGAIDETMQAAIIA